MPNCIFIPKMTAVQGKNISGGNSAVNAHSIRNWKMSENKISQRVKIFLQKKIARYLPEYINERNLVSKGHNEITILRQIVQMVGIIAIAWKISIGVGISIGIGYIIFCRYFGLFWDRNKGYDMEAEWGNKRNPFVRGVRRKLK